jgi:hypothetical protein
MELYGLDMNPQKAHVLGDLSPDCDAVLGGFEPLESGT